MEDKQERWMPEASFYMTRKYREYLDDSRAITLGVRDLMGSDRGREHETELTIAD
jgi:hypothetical protein